MSDAPSPLSPPPPVETGREAPLLFRLGVSLVVIAASSWLLFAHLGHYHLWTDEADTVLFGSSVWKYGDTLAKQNDLNYYMFRDGMMLENLRGRFTPPLQYYLVAPFWGRWGLDTFWLRVPFATCGLLGVLLLLRWLWRERAGMLMWSLLALGLLGNVEYFLYARQCRYYAVAMLLSMVIVYLYVNYDGRRRTLLGLVLASLALMATQYMNFVALYAGLAVDYAFFGRRRYRLSLREWGALLLPQLVVGLALAMVWNPIGKDNLGSFGGRWLVFDKLTLFWWNLRDLNTCEYGVGLLMLAAPLLHAYVPNPWLLRAPLAIAVYAAAVTLTSTQPVAITFDADIRYMAPVIPLCIFLTAASIQALTQAIGLRKWAAPVALGVALLAFGTNALHHPSTPEAWRSTPAKFVHEVAHPRPMAIAELVKWLNENKNLEPGFTVFAPPDVSGLRFNYPSKIPCFLVHPDVYCLMLYVPQLQYGWQLNQDKAAEKQFANLPPIHFHGRQPADMLIAFGEACKESTENLIGEYADAGLFYERVATLKVYFNDQTRPELFWHSFDPIEAKENFQNIYIYALYGPSPQPSTR